MGGATRTWTQYVPPVPVRWDKHQQGHAEHTQQDGGAARIVTFNDDGVGPDDGLFVKLQSWDEDQAEHQGLWPFVGRMVRVTVRALDEEDQTGAADRSRAFHSRNGRDVDPEGRVVIDQLSDSERLAEILVLLRKQEENEGPRDI